MSGKAAWTNFQIFLDGDGRIVPTFVDRVMNSKMVVSGHKMSIGEIETFQPTKNGKPIKLNVS